MPKKTIALIVVLLLITASLLYIAFTRTPQQANLPAPVVPTPTPLVQTMLAFMPNTLTVSTGSGSLSIDADTGDNAITAVQLDLQYDPKVLSNVDITIPANGIIQTPVVLRKEIDTQTGKVSFAFGIPPTGKASKGKGPVATLTFRTLTTTGQTSIVIGPESKVTAEGQRQSVLKQATGATIILSGRTSTTSAPLAPQATTSAR